jgi:chemotaxis protein MotB
MAEESPPAGAPEWVVTYGDTMSLLLTFFIMLVSMSEVKEDKKYQAMVESMRKQFGHDLSMLSLTPGSLRPRNNFFDKLATLGRAQKLDTHSGGDDVQGPSGDFPRVQIVRPGSRTAMGTVIYFRGEETALTEQQRAYLRSAAAVLLGKPQKIEIRGHTSLRPASPAAGIADNWDLAYRRCRSVYEVLTQDLKVESDRIRMSTAGASEPVEIGSDPIKLKQNSRVEVFLLDETVEDFFGSGHQLQNRFSPREP